MSADPNKVSTYVIELKKHGIKVIPPSIYNSDFGFSIINNEVVFGLLAIKGVGYETVNKILTIRNTNGKFKNFLQAFALLSKNGIGIKTAELLIKVGAFDELLNGKTKLYLLENLQEIYTKSKTTTVDGNFIIQPMLKDVVEEKSVLESLEKEQEELLGVNFASSKVSLLLSEYKGEYKLVDLSTATASPLVSHCLVKLTKFNEIKTKKGDAMGFADIVDDSKSVSHLSIFPGVYEKIKDILKKDNYYIVTIKNDARGTTALSFKNI
jgi:DNA polymerase-3 subunit alpha